jgi:phage tail protein X
MFSKGSRYKKLPDVITRDASGSAIPSKSLRLQAKADGKILHRIEDGDRLDHLAYKYYKQPGRWWRICDANPGFMFPQTMIGKDSMETIRFWLEVKNKQDNNFYELVEDLKELIGLEDLKIEIEAGYSAESPYEITDQVLNILQANGITDEVIQELENIKDEIFIGQKRFIARLRVILSAEQFENSADAIIKHSKKSANGEVIKLQMEQIEYILTLTYNQMSTTSIEIKKTIAALGFVVLREETVGRTGKTINIPTGVFA